MPAPILSSFAQRLYDSVTPLAYDDANQGYALAWYCAALGNMFQILDDYGRDQIVNDEIAPGWSQLLDLDRAPTEALGWMGQFVGVAKLTGLDDAAQRERIRNVGGWNRGTPGSIIAAAQQFLTGRKTVILRERDPAASAAQPAYGFTVITYTAETPNSAAVLAALMDQKPAGLILNYQVESGQDYQSLFLNHATYSNVYSTYATYEGIITDQPGI